MVEVNTTKNEETKMLLVGDYSYHDWKTREFYEEEYDYSISKSMGKIITSLIEDSYY